jgi:hypothetical protein
MRLPCQLVTLIPFLLSQPTKRLEDDVGDGLSSSFLLRIRYPLVLDSDLITLHFFLCGSLVGCLLIEVEEEFFGLEKQNLFLFGLTEPLGSQGFDLIQGTLIEGAQDYFAVVSSQAFCNVG